MSEFSGLWSKSNSKPGTPVGGFDSFSSLSSGGSNKPKKLESMSLQERQSHLQQQKKSPSGQAVSSGSTWDGLDLLGGGIAASEARGNTFKGNASNSGSLLDDDFNGPPVPLKGHQSDDGRISGIDNVDDLFDVFNRPPPPEVQGQDALSHVQDTGSSLNPSYSSSSISSSTTHSSDSRTSSRNGVQFNSNNNSQNGRLERDRIADDPTSNRPAKSDPRDPYIAELVDMGFSASDARKALATTSNGLNIQEAIEFLMTEAHKNSSEQQKRIIRNGGSSNSRGPLPPPRPSDRDDSQQDLTKLASEFSSQFISKAGSFWNQGRKNLAKAIEQYNNTSGSSKDEMPAWMKQSQKDSVLYSGSDVQSAEQEIRAATREVKLIEREREAERVSRVNHKPESRSSRQEQMKKERLSTSFVNDFDKDATPVEVPQFRRKERPSGDSAKRERPEPPISRAQKFKETSLLGDNNELYVSPARRRPQRQKQSPQDELKSSPPSSAAGFVREVIYISPTALEMAMSSKELGNSSFKLGDFSQASEHYRVSLQSIPPKHLLRPLVLSNLAACQIKLGDSKGALASAVEGLAVIGPGLGVGEEAETGKSLKDIWSKLTFKQAEALENMEKFKESLEVWNLLITNGYSNFSVIERRRRCQACLAPKPLKQKSHSTSHSDKSHIYIPRSEAGKEALQKIQNVHKEQEKLETEKFALLDNVEERINKWRSGNEDNLRALISTLHTILWEELGWKQISLAELVLPKKVKIAYMKAVAKTHPDKIPSNATTEQKMISQAVFITLNKSWDSFKLSNGLS